MNDLIPKTENSMPSRGQGFGSALPLNLGADAIRAIQEVQGSIVVAQQIRRNENAAFTDIMESCKRKSLAEKSMYAFPRAGSMITGPSIRLAEVLARIWGNVQYGVRELESNEKETKFEAYCWDVQTNVRASRIFTQKHGRWTKKGGFKKAEDPRDIYEIVASSAARRLRACILEIIPGDIVEAAVEQCQKTLAGGNGVPLKDRIRKMVAAFTEFGVTEEMLEARLGHKVDVTTEIELVNLMKIYTSLKDGMAGREDYFALPEPSKTDLLNKKFPKGEGNGQAQDTKATKEVSSGAASKKKAN